MQKVNKKCLGCGILKQTDNKNNPGYVLDIEHKYCMECFKLLNYGEVKSRHKLETYPNINENSLVLIIQSVLQLDLLFTLPVHRIQPNAKFVYIINQIDLLPKETNLDHFYNEIKKRAYKNKINFDDIVFMSAINNYDISNLKMFINSFNNKEVYLFGFQNSGKSTIFKGLTNNESVLNINKPGLTQDILEDNLDDKTLYDMPGIFNEGYISDYLTYDKYKELIPSKTIKPKVYTFNKNQRIVLNDLIEITTKKDEDVRLIMYISNKVKVSRYNILNKNNYLNENFEYVNKTFNLKYNKSHIQLLDIGFILLNHKRNITIKYPKNMHITLMESLLK